MTMPHETWEIPPEKQRSKSAQNLDDLKCTLQLWWQYMTGPVRKPPAPMITGGDKLPVVIVPGFICRPAIYKKMQAAIHAAGHPCHVISLGYQVSNLLGKGRKLSAYMDEQGIEEAYVVAHSMGGLILTSAIVQGEKRFRHGWTLGSPLFGTNIVWVIYALVAIIVALNISSGWSWAMVLLAFYLSPGLRQMMPKSDFLEFTSKHYDEMQNITSVFCEFDNIVFSSPKAEPGSTSRFRRETDVLFPEVGHNNIAMGDNSIAALVNAIQEKDRELR